MSKHRPPYVEGTVTKHGVDDTYIHWSVSFFTVYQMDTDHNTG